MKALCLLLGTFYLISTAAFADANNGQFMGYQLGDNYPATSRSGQSVNAKGNLVITAENPVKPANISDVSLIVTPESKTIGYIDASQCLATEADARQIGRSYYELLRAKYPDWTVGEERMNNAMQITEVSLNNAPHILRLQLDERNISGKQAWCFSMTLTWVPGSKPYQAWQNMSNSQHLTAKEDNRKKLLENADVRGL
jgi:hypothetical protein